MQTDLLLGMVALYVSGAAFAGSADYKCTIASHTRLESKGQTEPAKVNSRVGKTFTVDRQSGRITAPSNLRFHFGDPKFSVLAKGNTKNAFAVLITSPAEGEGVHLTALWIEEFDEARRKPFLVLASGVTYSGTCE